MKEEIIIAALVALLAGAGSAYVFQKKISADSNVQITTLENKVQSLEEEVKKISQAQATTVPSLQGAPNIDQVCQSLGGKFVEGKCGLPFASMQEVAQLRSRVQSPPDHSAPAGPSPENTGPYSKRGAFPDTPRAGSGTEIVYKDKKTDCFVAEGKASCQMTPNGRVVVCLEGKKTMFFSAHLNNGHIRRKFICAK